MIYLSVAFALLSAIVVSGTNPYLPVLSTEVAKLKTFVNDSLSHMNTSVTYQVQGRMGTALACWGIELGNYKLLIDGAVDRYLTGFLNKVKELLAETRTMTDDEIRALAAQVYGSNDSILTQLTEYETDFTNEANSIYSKVVQLEKITCNSTVTMKHS